MLKSSRNIFTILDICSSKIVCIIARIDNKNIVEILGIGYVKSDGIKGGIVSDLVLAKASIQNAVALAEKNAGVKASKVHVGISANYLISQKITTEVSIFGKEITHRELNKLLLDAIQICKNQKLRVLHTFACNYILDGHHGIANPIGMFGTKLACDSHILAATSSSLLNLDTVVSKAGLEVESYISSTYAAGLSVLTKDEMDNGTILIDFGSDTTSIGIFENEQLTVVDIIPIGGQHITRDIAKMFSIPKVEAEKVKTLYGVARNNGIELNEMLDVKIPGGGKKTISRDQLIEIIHARLEEMLTILKDKIKSFKINNFVITGGTARIALLDDLIREYLKVNVRTGYAKSSLQLQNNNLELVTSLGVINHITNSIPDDDIPLTAKTDSGKIKKFSNWFRKTFF